MAHKVAFGGEPVVYLRADAVMSREETDTEEQAQKQRIAVEDLARGMYVCELDRPWLDTPFLIQGFLIDTREDLENLKRYCRHVQVDWRRSRHNVSRPKGAVISPEFRQERPPSRPAAETGNRDKRVLSLLGKRTRRRYRDSRGWRAEMSAAKQAVAALMAEIKVLTEALEREEAYSLARLKPAINPLVSSIQRNPDACMWLARLQNQESYLYKHAVACAIWSVVLGRELGLPEGDLKTLGLGALLMDVGMLRLPRDLLQQREPLSEHQWLQFQSHVELGLQALSHLPMFTDDVRQMIACHHERHDGSGYPRGLRDSDIPLFAQIAGIVDCFDAMTSDRPYEASVSPSQAIRRLYRRRDRDFDAVLVEEFIQAVGLYPAGTLALLSSGEVAMVVAEGRQRRLKPQVLLLLDSDKRPLSNLRIVDLWEARCPKTGAELEIIQSLRPGAYGVDPTQIGLGGAR